MPQIEFHPPLGTTTTVTLPPLPVLPDDPHVLLTFRAKPIDTLNHGDRIEIWTDGGSPEWRAVPFFPAGEGEYTAEVKVGVEDGSFGYTYRIVHASGEEIWLGDMGGNGKVDLVMTEGEELWKGEEWFKFDTKEWTGFGVHIDERNVPSGVLISAASSSNLAFAYLHPSSAPFATYHPTSTAAAQSTAFALLSAPSAALSSTASTLVPVAQNTASAQTSPPAAYASYCGLGFSNDERTKAFRSLLGLSSRGFEYVPCTETKGHAVGVVCRTEGGEELVAYVGAGAKAEWNLSSLDVGKNGIALWNDESKSVKLVAGSTPSYQLAADTPNPVVQTLDIVHLFELSHEGTTVRLGFLPQGAIHWTLEPERTVVEQVTVDEVIQTPVLEAKALADTSDSGTADSSMGFTEGGFSDVGDETEVTSVEEVEDGATVGKGPVEEAEVVVQPEQDVLRTAELQSAEAGAEEDQLSIVEEPSTDNSTNDSAPTPEPGQKSILRFVWITLGFLNSLWWRTVSWFRQWTSETAIESPVRDEVPSNDEADEETPLVTETARGKDYASTSQQTLVPDASESNEPEPSTEEAAAPPAEEAEDYETIRVPETLTTVFPAHLSATKVKNDVFILSSLRDLAGLVAEFKLGEKDADWQSATLVEETVASDSDMSLVKLPMSGGEAQVRIRLA